MTLDFEPWYRDTRPGLVEAITRAVSDRGEATDAVDEALLRALERWDRVATMESPSGWAYTVALHAARRTFRRRLAQADLVGGTSPPIDAAPNELGGWVDDLPPRQAEAVRLRHEAELTEADIARRMGVTRSTVSSTLRTAYLSLARHLRPHEGNLTMDLQLARIRRGDPDGCDIAYLDADVTERAAYGRSVLDTIRIRRDDLVAVDVSADRPEIVWRWWHGTIESIGEARETADCRRPVGTAAGSAVKTVQLPPGLRDAARPGTSVWFGSDGDDLVAVAIGSGIEAARGRLDHVRAAYE